MPFCLRDRVRCLHVDAGASKRPGETSSRIRSLEVSCSSSPARPAKRRIHSRGCLV
jgi:hypothetical protein